MLYSMVRRALFASSFVFVFLLLPLFLSFWNYRSDASGYC